MNTFINLTITFTILLLVSCKGSNDNQEDVQSPTSLVEHSATFEKGVVQVTTNVYVAIGYGLANSIMIEGDEGLIIVDTMETKEEANNVLAEFRKISAKPVKAIIYTHNHADHVFGAATFAEAGTDVKVYAHDSTQYYINRVVNTLRPIITTRSMRMFGSHLTQDELVNAGIGPFLGVQPHSHLHSLTPTDTFENELALNIEGIEITLIHAPGETEDQILVWLPQQKVLLPGDNIYKTFPNLYTIRGTYYRDVNKWITSLDIMRQLKPEFLIPSHTRPIVGQKEVSETLTVYRDAIQYIHDQTVRYMNKGMAVDEIVPKISLPLHLKQHRYLQEFYGTVNWSVRSIFSGYMGWFDGNPTNLRPFEPKLLNKKYAELAGGVGSLWQELNKAFSSGDHQWVLMLSDMLKHSEFEQQAKVVKAKSLRKLAEKESNPNARHYYFTQAMELENDDFSPAIFPKPEPEFVKQLPIDNIFRSMPAFLKAEETLEVTLSVEFYLSDIDQIYMIQIRNGIAEVQDYSFAEADVKVATSAQVWKEIATKITNPMSAIMSNDLSITTGKFQFIKFLSYFDLPNYD